MIMVLAFGQGCAKSSLESIPEGNYTGQWHQVTSGIDMVNGLWSKDTSFTNTISVAYTSGSIAFTVDGIPYLFEKNGSNSYNNPEKWDKSEFVYIAAAGKLTYHRRRYGAIGPDPLNVEFVGLKE